MQRLICLVLFSAIFLDAACLDSKDIPQSYSAISQFLVTITGTNLTASEVLYKLQTLISSLNGEASDLNECEMIIDLCNDNSTCINTLGSYLCLCPTGFVLQGNSTEPCQDIDECLDHNNNCSANGECLNTPGGYSCVCSAGYSGDGTNCEDFDECLFTPCSKTEMCINNLGSYSCQCRSGFVENSKYCKDVDECMDEALNDCHESAYCLNTNGSYVCHCKDGFEGSGNSCEDVDECEVFDFCHAYAICDNHDGSFSCQCKPGFVGNGYYCQDIDECYNNLANCANDAGGQCFNTIGSYSCACASGYRGDGINCTQVAKPNECLLGTHDCHDQATCTFDGDDYFCVCNATSYDNQTMGRDCLSPVVVRCTTSSIIVEVIADYYLQKQIQMNKLHFNDFLCSGRKSPSSEHHWEFVIDNLSACGTVVSKNQTHITYSNILSNSVQSGVYMGTLVSVPFSCSYPSNITVALPTPYYPEANVISIPGPNGTGTFVVEMNLFTDSTYTAVSNTTTFATTDIIYVQTKLTADDNNLVLLIHDCWATPTSSGTDPLAYYFIAKGCPIAGRVADTVHVTMNGVGKVARFNTQVFGFVDYNSTYFHCTVDLCSENARQVCKRYCDEEEENSTVLLTRRKRLANDDVLSLGPFINKESTGISETSPKKPAGVSPYTIMICTFSIVIAILLVVVLYFVLISRKERKNSKMATCSGEGKNSRNLRNSASNLPVMINKHALEMVENNAKSVVDTTQMTTGSLRIEFNGV